MSKIKSNSGINIVVLQTHFSVNLDDLHTGPEGPFYTLSKIDPQRQNVFQLSSVLYFIDGTVSEEFVSRPFHIRTKGKPTRTDDATITTSVSSHPLRGHITVHTLVSDRVIASTVEFEIFSSQEFGFLKVRLLLEIYVI